MQGILFSIPDLSLIATIIECVLIYCLIVIARAIPSPSSLCRHSLGLLFAAIALDSLAMLLIWHEGLRFSLESASPISITISTLALTSKGPLLYLFIKTLTTPNFSIKPIHALHALPFAAAFGIVLADRLTIHDIATTLDSDIRVISSVYWWTITRATPVAYAVASIISLRHMKALYDSHYTGDEYHYAYWIKFLTFGFLFQWLSALCTHIAGQYLSTTLADTLGKANDFAGLILVNGLLVYCFTLIRTLTPILGTDEPKLARPEKTSSKTKPTPTPKSTKSAIKPVEPLHTSTSTQTQGYKPTLTNLHLEPHDEATIATIKQAIEEDRIHLNHTLNLEKFADALEQPAKEVSRLINTHFQYSFSEFINAYRTLEAEKLLASPDHKETPILEIIYLSGFNSKSAFHRFFKRFTGMSPSEYRNQTSSPSSTDSTHKDTDAIETT